MVFDALACLHGSLAIGIVTLSVFPAIRGTRVCDRLRQSLPRQRSLASEQSLRTLNLPNLQRFTKEPPGEGGCDMVQLGRVICPQVFQVIIASLTQPW